MRALLLIAALSLVACEREERDLRPRPSLPALQGSESNPAEERAFDVAEGKRLFRAYNCNGCHANGGGGMGPALIDDKWIYGSEPAQVFATIVQGRPNGMPSFRGRLPDHQVWQIAAYVRSMSGLVRTDAAPGRNDDMQANPPEHSIDTPKPPQQGGTPR
jgi:cytochrome c oxidase cbb3-type subunit 3